MLETVVFTGPMLDAGFWILVEDPVFSGDKIRNSSFDLS
jgi:hypothetical protein